jgi:hypothetical protein
MSLAVLVLSPACFDLSYKHPACTGSGECPDGWLCNEQGSCERCDPMAPFKPPMLLQGLQSQSFARLSPDELTLYSWAGTDMHGTDLFMWTRMTRSAEFTPAPAELLTKVNSMSNEVVPTVSGDGRTLVFASDRESMIYHLYMATRVSTSSDFDTPLPLTAISSVDATKPEVQSFLTTDGEELWFVSNRDDGKGDDDIYRAIKTGSNFSNPKPVAALNSTMIDRRPTLSDDKLTIYFASDRDTPGQLHLWTSHRNSVTDEFPEPKAVHEFDGTVAERPSWLSNNNCRLYLDSGGPGIYVARRDPL